MIPFLKHLVMRTLPMTSTSSSGWLQQFSGLKTFSSKEILSAKEISLYKNLFDKMDSNGDGLLTKNDLKQGLMDSINYTATEKELDETMDTLDRNKDGSFGFGDFIEYIAWSKQMMMEDAIKYAFETFDADNDGFINIEELKEALLSLGFNANDLTINNIMLSNNKKNNENLTLEEFRKIFYNKKHLHE